MHNKVLTFCKFTFALALGVIVSAVLYFGLLHGGSPRSAHAQAVETPTPVPTAEPTSNPGSQNLQPIEGKVNPPKYPNMDSNLNHIIQQVESGQNTIQVAAARAPLHTEGSVAVTIHITEGYVDALLEFLKVEGTFPRNVGIDYIEAYVPVSLLPETSVQEGVISIRTIVPPQPAQETIVSQGASVHGATAWHDAGFKGQNVKVGIIDVDFEDYSSHIGAEVPEPVEVRCYLENAIGAISNLNTHTTNLSDCENGNVHGTAVTEALFDIAPEATYYIANPLTWGDLVDAVDWMVEHDVDIINMSVAWQWSGPGDGESPYSSSPLKAVDSAVDGGIMWLNAAGNNAMATWYGPFTDVDADGWHDFSGEDECNNLSFELEAGERVSAQLRWDDSWNTPATDMDLYLSLVEQSGLTDVAMSEDDQTETLEPFEFVSFTASVSGIYCLSTKLYSGNAPDWIQLQSFTGQDLEYHILHHSIGEPADSANAGLLAVGAAHVSDTSTIEDFSSRGPTTDDRTKPDLVGADNVHSAAYGEEFSGTSQASPHVAGLAALVKQRFPDHTPQQIASYLKNHTEERGEPGADNTWGHGFARLLASDAATPVPTVTPEPSPDRAVLVALYNATDGDNWTDKDNWLSDEPLEEWQGVATDDEGRVIELHLWENNLQGSIPSELGNLYKLTTLELQSNQLTGEIPSELGNLSNLTSLYLWENDLSGEIPAELGNLASLTVLDLPGNELSGEIPAELGNLSNLTVLFLARNQLSGEIPSELGSLSNLVELELYENDLSGEIPNELGNLASLTVLDLGVNQLSGEIPAELGNLSNLTVLSLWENELSGEVPPELGSLSNLEVLSLSYNQLSGEIPTELGALSDLEELYLNSNKLIGEIPSELSGLANLTELYLWGNELSGEIPSELGSLANLQHLNLTRNQLSGEIPAEFGSLSKMESMSLSRNRLSGEIPSELGGLSNLDQLYLYDNQLSGDIPSELLAISGLRILALYGNQLSGGVPEHADEKAILTTLYNSTGGTGWKENENWGSAEPVFTWTQVAIDNSGRVTALWLNENELSGEIPSELSDLENLEELYLAGNQLSGCIPTGLKDVPENDFADTGLPFCDEELPDVSPDCTDYSESPDLAEKVASGDLPSVCDRLPAEPLTIQTLDDTGEYGGMLRRFYLGLADSCNFFRISRASLVRFSRDGFSLIPSVAKDWEVSDDGKEWTFHLREGMKWSDGDDFTADDFVWQYENVILNEELTPGPPFFLRIGNDVGSIEKVDDNTVKFVFPQPNFLFLEAAAQADEACYGSSKNVPWAPSHYMQQFHIDHNPDVEQEAQDAGFDDWVEYYNDKMQYRLNPDKPTIAPWKFTNPLGEQVVISERNPYFWAVDPDGNQLPYLDGIQMTLVANTEAGTLMAAQGDIDMQGRHIRLDQYVPLREHRIDGGYTVLTWPTFGGTDVAFFFNMSLPGPTGEAIRTKEFRQALSLAIDRESIKEVMFLGFGELRQNVPPPGHPHYPGDDVAKLRTEYDVEEANRLLDSVFPDKDDEGFRLSNGERIVMRVTVTEAFGPWPDAAQVVGRAWDAVGVKTDVDQTSRGENFDRWWTNEWAVMVWNDDTTSSTFSQIGTRAPADNAFHGPGCALWIDDPDGENAFPCPQESLDLLDMHRRGPGLPEAERNALGQEIYKTVVENQYSIGIVGLSPMVQGVVVKKNTLHNVPDAAANDWTFRTPNSAFPEQWYFGPEIELVVALPAALSVGTSHACALDLNDVISCQGVNDSEQVTGLPPYGVFTAISVGEKHSCAIDVFGRMHCWGSDEHGQVSGRPSSGEFIAVGAGARHTCAVDATGFVHCWGSDDDGQSSPPAEGRFVAIGAGDSHTCGLLSDGTLECWGVFSSNSE